MEQAAVPAVYLADCGDQLYQCAHCREFGSVKVSFVSYFQYFGKLLFWTFMSSVPDVMADTVIGRALDSREDITVVGRVAREMGDGR